MRRIIDGVFGLRRDVPLSKRWWHRLFVVLFTLVLVAVSVCSVLVVYREPDTRSKNIRVIDNLRAYTSAHPELANTVPAFQALGRVGATSAKGTVDSLYLPPDSVFCSADLIAHLEDVPFLGDDLNAASRQELLKRIVAKLEEERAKGGERRVCFFRPKSDLPNSDSIIAYSFTPAATVRAWAGALARGALVLLGCAFVLTNLYYRALIYIVFGAPRRGGAAAQQADAADDRAALRTPPARS